MIRRLLARLIPGRATRKQRAYGSDQHAVRRERLSHAARTVIRKLQDEGFHAYVVGGAVRDLLLGIDPKDFDVSANREDARLRLEVSPKWNASRL